MMNPMYNDIFIDGDDDSHSAYRKLTAEVIGYTIARTSRILGMSKQSVDKAVRKGALRATRMYITTDTGNKLISTEVDRESVHAYALAKDGRPRVPKGFRANQMALPGT